MLWKSDTVYAIIYAHGFVVVCFVIVIQSVHSRFTCLFTHTQNMTLHIRIYDDVIKWKYFPRNWLFVRGIQRSPANSLHKGQWRGALMFSFFCAWINGWVNNRETGDLRRHCAYYDVTVMYFPWTIEEIPKVLGKSLFISVPFTNRSTLIPARINNHMASKVCDEITHPFPNFSCCPFEVGEWINDFFLHDKSWIPGDEKPKLTVIH